MFADNPCSGASDQFRGHSALGVVVRKLQNSGVLPGRRIFPDLADLNGSLVWGTVRVRMGHENNSATALSAPAPKTAALVRFPWSRWDQSIQTAWNFRARPVCVNKKFRTNPFSSQPRSQSQSLRVHTLAIASVLAARCSKCAFGSHLRLRIFLEMGAGRIRKKPGQGMIFDHCASAASADASRGSNSAIRARNSSSVGCHFRSTSCSRAATFSFRAPMVKFSSCNAAICARLGERRSSCLVHLSCNTRHDKVGPRFQPEFAGPAATQSLNG